MPIVKSYKYDLSGSNTIEVITGKFYKFTQNDKKVFVPEYDIHKVEGFIKGNKKCFVKNHSYKLFGENDVEEITGIFYKFTKDGMSVFVPEYDFKDIEIIIQGGKRKSVRKSRRNRRRYSRHS